MSAGAMGLGLEALAARFPGLRPGPGGSWIVPRACAVELARFLRDDPAWRLDYLSNATGVDWLGRDPETDGEGKGYLETVYHLYSVALKKGPVVLRVRTRDREDTAAPSLTPVWRAAEFQEREVFDLFGIRFEGHPDLRRLLMWDEFEGHPMRKDYTEPDDYEYEPTPHGPVLEKARRHLPPAPAAGTPAAGTPVVAGEGA